MPELKDSDPTYIYYAPDLTKNPVPVFTAEESNTAYVDIETFAGKYGDALDTRCNQIRLIALKVESSPVIHLFDMLGACSTWWNEVNCLLDSFQAMCCHNMMFDLSCLRRFGLPYPRKCLDTMIASQVLCNGTTYRHGLKELIDRHLGLEISKEEQTSDWGRKSLTFEQLRYAATDVQHLPKLHAAIAERLEVRSLTPTYELEMAFLPALVNMNTTGIAVDKEQWLARAGRAEARLAELEPQLLAMFPRPEPIPEKIVRKKKSGEEFSVDVRTNVKIAEANLTRKWNLASPIQLKKMFEMAGVDLPNTAYETLVAYQDEHEAIGTLLKWRDTEKEATTFGRDWLKHCYPNGRVYPEWWQLGAATGRMTCSQPNMQQVPRGECRKGIVASEGHMLVRADFSQIEARIAAKISKDDVLIELFQKGDDIHAYAAKAVLGKLTVTPAERQIGKSLVFGLLFSMSAKSLRVYCRTNYGVTFTLEEAEVFRDRFFRTFYGLARWHDRVRKTCNDAKEFRTLLGRRRLIVQNPEDVNMLGLALNTPVQGTAADMLKVAVREVWERRDEMPEARLLALIHDEIILEVMEEKAEAAGVWLRAVMVEAGNMILDPIPCDASVKIGRSWGG